MLVIHSLQWINFVNKIRNSDESLIAKCWVTFLLRNDLFDTLALLPLNIVPLLKSLGNEISSTHIKLWVATDCLVSKQMWADASLFSENALAEEGRKLVWHPFLCSIYWITCCWNTSFGLLISNCIPHLFTAHHLMSWSYLHVFLFLN